MEQKTNEQIAMRVSVVSIIGNLVLTFYKLFAGVVAGSAAMVSDAVHSASDVFSTVVVMIGVKLSNQKPDREHPYGHERLECVAAIILAMMLGLTGIGIGLTGFEKIMAGDYVNLAIPGKIALQAAIVSIVAKEAMYWYTRAAGKKINSGALIADAWHHRSDALSSVGSFVGILGARMGYPILDFVASIVIAILVVKVAVDIFRDATHKMTDRACDEATITEIREIITGQEGVLGIDLLKTRLFGDKIYVDVEIAADGSVDLHSSHSIAHRVHDAIEHRLPTVKHCMVHVNPAVEGE